MLQGDWEIAVEGSISGFDFEYQFQKIWSGHTVSGTPVVVDNTQLYSTIEYGLLQPKKIYLDNYFLH